MSLLVDVDRRADRALVFNGVNGVLSVSLFVFLIRADICVRGTPDTDVRVRTQPCQIALALLWRRLLNPEDARARGPQLACEQAGGFEPGKVTPDRPLRDAAKRRQRAQWRVRIPFAEPRAVAPVEAVDGLVGDALRVGQAGMAEQDHVRRHRVMVPATGGAGGGHGDTAALVAVLAAFAAAGAGAGVFMLVRKRRSGA